MSICIYTYNSKKYVFNPDKINYIQDKSPGHQFVFRFDSTDSIIIPFNSYDEGMTWIQDNLMSGECPSLSDLAAS